MAEEFKPIETQEQLDSIIKDRIDRAKRSAASEAEAKFSDYDDIKKANESLNSKIEDLTSKLKEAGEQNDSSSSELDELKKKVAAYEIDSVKTKVAADEGLPLDALQFLSGKDEDEIRKSAETLKTMINKNVAPLANPESKQEEDGVTAAFKKLNPNLNV